MWTKEHIDVLTAKLGEVAVSVVKTLPEVALMASKIVFQPESEVKLWDELPQPIKILCLQVYPQLQVVKWNEKVTWYKDDLYHVSFNQNGFTKSVHTNDVTQLLVKIGLESWSLLPEKATVYLQEHNIVPVNGCKIIDNSEGKPYVEWHTNQAEITTYDVEYAEGHVMFDNEGNVL